MKLKQLHETVGHWRVAKGAYEFYGDPKNKRESDDLSFRLKDDDPKGGIDKTQALETGAAPLGHGKDSEIGMEGQPGDPRGGSDEENEDEDEDEPTGGTDKLHGSGRVAGGELNAWKNEKSQGIKIK